MNMSGTFLLLLLVNIPIFLQLFLIAVYYFVCPHPSKHEQCPVSLDLLDFKCIFNIQKC